MKPDDRGPATNEDRDGVVVYKGDDARLVDDETGATKRVGVVVDHPRDGWVMVRWKFAQRDVRVRCSSITITEGKAK